MSFRLKTILGIALIELTVMVILITANQVNLGGSASQQLYDRTRATSQLFSTMVADSVISFDLATLDAMVENVKTNEELEYIRVLGPDGTLLTEGGNIAALSETFTADPSFETAVSDHRIDLEEPIVIEGQSFGSIQLGISTLDVEAEIADALRWNMIIAAIGMSLVAVFGYILGSILTRQLQSLRVGAEMIATGDLGYQIPIHSKDEIGQTARRFNEMATYLATDRSELEKRQSELLDKKGRVEKIVGCMTRISENQLHVTVPETDRGDEVGDMARATVIFQEVMQEIDAARLKQQRLINAFDQIEEHVVIFGTDGKAIFANNAFRDFNREILQELDPDFTLEDFLEEGLRQDGFPGAGQDTKGWLRRRLDTSDHARAPVEIERAPGRVFLFRKTVVDGIGMALSASDVTELRESQSKLVQASKLATLGEMATGIAHELNQPLGVIRMAAKNCMKRMDDGRLEMDYLQSKLERVDEQTDRASQIINHMRIFGRRADEEPSAFNMVEAVENINRLMRRQLLVDDIMLILTMETDAAWTLGQQVLFEQVFLNLISNARDAIQSNKRGEGNGVIQVTGRMVGSALEVEVKDNGGGIPKDALERLFDPFFTTKEPGKGTGLGLSISYGVIKDIGGTISATNEGLGAIFTIRVPTRATAAPFAPRALKSA